MTTNTALNVSTKKKFQRAESEVVMAKKNAKARSAEQLAFIDEWNSLDKMRRRQIRRLVRIGKEQENVADAKLAVQFAAYQRSRTWYSKFWLWFVPLVIAGFVAGLALHPIILGMIAGVAGNAILVRRSFKRADWVNEQLLD
ncbi:MAG: hypothetical protein RLZZ31_993 [Actinomycetota bacterium]|jgi:hypothetical protein